MLKSTMTHEPIAAIATALSPAALGIVRISGDDCIDMLSQLFSRPDVLRSAAGNTVVHGWLSDCSGNELDEVLINVYRAPRSFTGEESAEIMCHGGLNVVTAVYTALIARGFRAAERGEFSFRSFANGKTDLAKAEAIREIIDAQTDAARSKAAGRLAGNLSTEITSIKKSIVSALAAIEVELDYPEDEATAAGVFKSEMISTITQKLTQLAETWNTEKLYQEGAKVVLCGRTNAGKSSIFNMMLKEERAIVSDIQGTTRDWLESIISCGGIPVRLFDTAGLRETTDEIEKRGVERTKQLAEDADLILYVADSCDDNADNDVKSFTGSTPVIGIWNKVDTKTSRPVPADSPVQWIPVSAKTGSGLQDVTNAIRIALHQQSASAASSSSQANAAALGSLHQKEAVLTAAEKLQCATADMQNGQPLDILAEDLMEAVQSLGEITGETLPEDILGAVFSQFCVGK